LCLRCNHSDILEYVLYYNEQFQSTDLHQSVTREGLARMLKKDIKITHRSLYHISVKAYYNPLKIIKLLNNHKEVTLEEPKMIFSVKEAAFPKIQPYKETKKTAESDKETKKTAESDKETKKTAESDKECATKESPSKKKVVEESEEVIFDAIQAAVEDDKCLFCLQKCCVCQKQKVWDEKYAEKLTHEKKKEVVATIKNYLNECDMARSSHNKVKVCVKMYNYMAKHARGVIGAHPKFKGAVVDKIKEFRADECWPMMAQQFKPKTKEFINDIMGEDMF